MRGKGVQTSERSFDEHSRSGVARLCRILVRRPYSRRLHAAETSCPSASQSILRIVSGQSFLPCCTAGTGQCELSVVATVEYVDPNHHQHLCVV